MDQKYISASTRDEFEKELKERKEIKRPEIAKKIAVAKDFGDLSENAEYSAAREEQGFNESRIAELEYLLKNSIVYEKRTDNTVGIGSRVGLLSGQTKKEYTIVDFKQSDPQSGKISNESPLGLALLNKTVGDTVEIKTVSNVVVYKIISINND